jgi:hypothetical protein
MHLRGTVRRAGLPVAVAVLLLAGCSSSEEGPGEAPSGSAAGSTGTPGRSTGPTGSTGSTGSAEETAAFCTQSASLTQSLNTALGEVGDDPGRLAPVLQQAADQYGAVQAPAAIEADWRTLTDGIDQLATAAAAVDPATPDARARLQAAFNGIAGGLTTAAVNVESYAAANCPSAAPTG